MAEIPADAGKGHGLFENLHGAPNGEVFARILMDVSQKYYGTAILAFLKQLTQDFDSTTQRVRELKAEFLSAANLPTTVSGQVHRVAGRFALVTAAGELAIEYGIVPWKKGDAAAMVMTCFRAWLSQRGGAGDLEVDKALEQVRSFIQENPTRFAMLRDDGNEPVEDKTIKRAGFTRKHKDRREWLVFPQVFREDVCAGLSAKEVARVLKDRGHLTQDSEGKTTKPERVPGLGKKPIRMYVINDSIMGESSNAGVSNVTGVAPDATPSNTTLEDPRT
ncbi:MAG: hypothetical protein AABZ06_11045 [Bdellovibrionota bacterium]